MIAVILHSVRRSRRGHHDLALAQFPRLVSDDERSAPVQHVIDLVLALVRVDFLLLPRFQAINVAEEILRLEEIDLPHLLAGKLRRRENILNIHFALLRKTVRSPAFRRNLEVKTNSVTSNYSA